MNREHDAELMECRKCGVTFDLARQDYFYDLCPPCNRADEEDN